MQMPSNCENLLGLPLEQADKLPNCQIHKQFKTIFICEHNCTERILYCRECSTIINPGSNINIHNHAPIYIADACSKIAQQSQSSQEEAEDLFEKATDFIHKYKIVLEYLDQKLRGNGDDYLINPQSQNKSMMFDFYELTKLVEIIKQTNDYLERKAVDLKVIDVFNKKNQVDGYIEQLKRYEYLGKVTFQEVWQKYHSIFFQDEQLNLSDDQLDLDNFKLLTYIRHKISAQKNEFLEERVKTLEKMLKTKFDQLNQILENQLGADKIN
ncbi:UNKNOWN [Stylonychia lemnae]|uniref:Uncharacterized protein n=1 Tax=Stylonychia lemnae TaxID=5949 RepID=A0A078AJM8_STYLE|nr:UNKNOWN [Stylonychia lemnae]|eukprot:CDW81013.1 UNKNOWN [Stylonychia lemnae]